MQGSFPQDGRITEDSAVHYVDPAQTSVNRGSQVSSMYLSVGNVAPSLSLDNTHQQSLVVEQLMGPATVFPHTGHAGMGYNNTTLYMEDKPLLSFAVQAEKRTILASVGSSEYTYEDQPNLHYSPATSRIACLQHSELFAPPALPRRVPIALPPLSPHIPIQLHPLITYRHSTARVNPPLHWNMTLPPSASRLAPALSGYLSSRWMHEPALEPQIVESLVIRVSTIERPIVVFPARTGDPIRIVDVLQGISSAIRAAIVPEAIVGLVYAMPGGSQNHSRNLAVADAKAADAIGRHFRRKVYWGGLSESPAEQDVWILRFYGPRRGGSRVLV